MKSQNAFILMIALLGLAACKKDNPSTGNDELVGNWELTAFTYDGTSTTTVGTDNYTSNFSGAATDITASVEFKADGTYESMGTYTIDLTYDIGGQNFSQPYTINDFIGSGTYVRNGNDVTITDDQSGSTSTATITKLSGGELEMDVTITRSTTQQGATSVVVVDGHAVLQRK